jgi:esterase/lipase superfamily enzyme
MGNRCLLRLLSLLKSRTTFGQIFLTAPDVDRLLFASLATICPPLSNRTTLYLSRRDRALRVSTKMHAGDRAGRAPPVFVMDNVDSIDVSEIDLSFIGHG